MIPSPPDVIPFGYGLDRDAGPAALWPRRKTSASGQDVWLAAQGKLVVVPRMEGIRKRGRN
jgi:hypothetical protein